MSSLADETRWIDATGQAELIATGHVQPAALLEAAIERIEQLNPTLNAVVMRWYDRARATIAEGLPGGLLRGVPFLLKDLAAPYAGAPMANANRALRRVGEPAMGDSTLVARFRAAGLVTLGRTNASEFGTLAGTEPLAWGPTHNPWRTTMSPGGSSGGSAAAVASGMVPLAHATDASGSIRVPASCCGLVGLKPSQGRISNGPRGDETRAGVGFCLTRTVRDAALMLDAVRGPGVGDTVIAPPPTCPYRDEIGNGVARLHIGVLDHDPTDAPVDSECRLAVQKTAELLEALGREATSDDVEPVNWERAQLGRRVTGAEYARARQATVQFRREVQQWWADGKDLLLTPTIGEVPSRLGAMRGDNPAAGELSRRCVTFTKPFNLSGQPAISLPVHQSADGLPIGVQLVAGYGREDQLLRVAAQLERSLAWPERRPSLGEIG